LKVKSKKKKVKSESKKAKVSKIFTFNFPACRQAGGFSFFLFRFYFNLV